MESLKIADYLTSDIIFMIDNKDIYDHNNFNLWYDEIDFDINDVAKHILSKFPNSTLINMYHNGFNFKWNNMIIYIRNNYDI